MSARCGAVTRMTLAPSSASDRDTAGPAMTRVRSTTLRPASGRAADEEDLDIDMAMLKELDEQLGEGLAEHEHELGLMSSQAEYMTRNAPSVVPSSPSTLLPRALL